MYMYYTEIVPEQKKFNGGGVKEEGEQITEVRLPLSEMDRFLADYEQESLPLLSWACIGGVI